MPAGAGGVADLGQQIADAAMGMNVIGIDAQGGFEMSACRLVLAHQQQQIGEVDMPDRIIRVMPNSLAEQRARGAPISGFEHERAKVVEHAEIAGLAADQFEIVAFGLLEKSPLS